MKLKKILAGILLAVLCASMTAADDIPTLFHNDEPWYKDGVSPLIERDGKRFIPADIFTMFDYMSVTVPSPNNLLIHNTATGDYVSMLFLEQSALMNGTVHRNISIFRDGGVYYVEADVVCQELGFTTRIYIREDGGISMQICDDTVLSASLNELVQSYLPSEPEQDGFTEDAVIPETEESEASLIYLFCGDPDASAEFRAHDILKKNGLAYTIFFDAASDPTELIRHGLDGLCGLDKPGNEEDPAAELDALNEEFAEITRRRLTLTRSTGDEAKDEALRTAGYFPVTPDFTVNGGSNPDALIWEIMLRAERDGSCTVWLEDCWNTVKIADLIGQLNREQYRTANYITTVPGR